MPVFTSDFAVLVEDGQKFDLAKTLGAMAALVDACALSFGQPVIRTIHQQYDARLPWDAGGKEVFRHVWIRAGQIYDAVCEPMVAVFDAICLKLFPLGKATCVYYTSSEELLTSSGKPIGDLDPKPIVEFWGPERDLNLFDIARPSAVAAIKRLLPRIPECSGLAWMSSDPFHVSTDMVTIGQFASVAFPHGVFGDGRGPIRVRCVRKD